MGAGDQAGTVEVIKVNVGDVLDNKYRIIRALGRGAWGNVYEGVNDRIGRRVAIKVLHPEYSERRDMLERFEREARTATQIESEHVVSVLDLGAMKDGRPYIVMEFLNGEDLAQHLARVKTIEPKKAAIIALQALRGLSEAHAEGILHRDIKPDNIYLCNTKANDRIVKIVDFGISKAAAGTQNTSMTQTGSMLGSPMYMSPEQCRGAKRVDVRTDLYSLGVCLYEAVTGRMPYEADTFNELMFKIALEDPPDPRVYLPDLDANFAGIIARAIQRDPDKRFATALDFYGQVAAWLEARGVSEADWHLGASMTAAQFKDSGNGRLASPLSQSMRRPMRSSSGSEQTLVPEDKKQPASATLVESGTPKAVPDAAHSDSALTSSATTPPKRSKTGVIVAVLLVLGVSGVGLVLHPIGGDHGKNARDDTPPRTTATATAETTSPVETARPTTPAATEGPTAAAVASEGNRSPTLPRVLPRVPAGVRGGPRTPVGPTPPGTTVASAAPIASPEPAPPPAPPPPPQAAADAGGKGVIEGRTVRTSL
jgi:serine/threonine-protein kinase